MNTKLTPKQERALETLIIFLDELGNKPRRLFDAMIKFNNAFTEDTKEKRRITRQFKKLQDVYYQFLNRRI